MGHGVQQESSGQHEIQAGHGESEVRNKLLDDLENEGDIMSVNMGDLGSVVGDFIWTLLQFGSIYLLGKFGFSFWMILFGLCLIMVASSWGRRSTRSPKCRIIDPTHEKDTELLETHPAWVRYPDMERAEWLNRIIGQVWPSVEVWLTSTLAR